jgi:hypothetical protein
MWYWSFIRPDAVLTCAIASERLKSIAGRYSHVIERACEVEPGFVGRLRHCRRAD